jgi:trehalose-phosphatase
MEQSTDDILSRIEWCRLQRKGAITRDEEERWQAEEARGIDALFGRERAGVSARGVGPRPEGLVWCDSTRLVAGLANWLARGGRLLLLTDYDGTLTPLVQNPDEAWLPQAVRDDLQALARTPGVHLGVVSGRDLADLRERVTVPEAVYAGSYGLEIDGPGMSFRHPEALAQEETLLAISVDLSLRARTVPGMYVELKRFGVAVHYRHVPPDQVGRVDMEIARAIRPDEGRLRIFHGTKVIEIQPRVAWTKGDCALWISDVIQRTFGNQLMVSYMGDDWTDEPAFEALAGYSITIRVGSEVPSSTAAYRLPDVVDAQRLVRALAACICGRNEA